MTDDRRYRLVLEFEDSIFEEQSGITTGDVAGELAIVATHAHAPLRKAWIEPMDVQPCLCDGEGCAACT